jgi:hypothetical protein
MNREAESRKLAIQALKEAPPAILFQTPIDQARPFRVRDTGLCLGDWIEIISDGNDQSLLVCFMLDFSEKWCPF